MKILKETHKMSQTLISDTKTKNEEMDKLRQELRQLKRVVKENDKKLDVITTQTKKKTPTKRPPKPKDDSENGPKKKVFKACDLKKIIIFEK